MLNLDPQELHKFEAIGSWWDPEGPMKMLHRMNPCRLRFVQEHVELAGRQAIDVGCGGGLLAEAIAQQGATVLGIDASASALQQAQDHVQTQALKLKYQNITAEELAEKQPAAFDVLTCMELLEHVPDPLSLIRACARLVKPGGKLFFSTLNRNPKAFLFAIIGAEYIAGLLPRGTHEYGKFIRPSELTHWIRETGLHLQDLRGIQFHPLTRHFQLSQDVSVNYLICAGKPE